MRVFKTKLNGRNFKLTVAVKNKDRVKGLSDTTNLSRGKGMLFVFEDEQDVTFNTENMNYPIDMLFMDEDWVVIDYVIGYPKREMRSEGIKYVIEVNAGELPAQAGTKLMPDKDVLKYVNTLDFDEEDKNDEEDDEDDDDDKNKENDDEENDDEEEEYKKRKSIIKKKKRSKKNNIIITRIGLPELEVFKKGGKIIKAIEDKIKHKDGFMQVLDDGGTILMNIEGGERIFSRVHTKKVVESARKVKNGEMTKKEFGSIIMEMLDVQDNQEAEYVYE
ncbi:MAG: DUF192 domain-containing protein [Chlamydiia bacterium]|nr:DUF192 domain-containing protein [Chlamydiia bacterium]